LLDGSRAVLGCAEVSAEAGEEEDAWVERLVAEAHRALFAPRVDLSQADATSLDGSNRVSRDPLEDLLGQDADLLNEPP
jgi:hypothetical protein